jgi:hypothetical protein
MWRAQRKCEKHTEFLLGSLKRDYREDQGVDGRIILKWILRKHDLRVWTGFICLRIGIGGGLL